MSRNKPPPQLRSDSCRDTSSVFGNMPSGRKVLSLLNFSSLFVFHVFLFSTFSCSVLHKISRFIQPLFHKYGKGKLPSQQPILNLQSPISQTGTGVLNEGPFPKCLRRSFRPQPASSHLHLSSSLKPHSFVSVSPDGCSPTAETKGERGELTLTSLTRMYRARLKAVPRLRECCRQSLAEAVSKSGNKIHQTWGPPLS